MRPQESQAFSGEFIDEHNQLQHFKAGKPPEPELTAEREAGRYSRIVVCELERGIQN